MGQTAVYTEEKKLSEKFSNIVFKHRKLRQIYLSQIFFSWSVNLMYVFDGPDHAKTSLLFKTILIVLSPAFVTSNIKTILVQNNPKYHHSRRMDHYHEWNDHEWHTLGSTRCPKEI